LEVKATAKYVRISPRKARQAVDLIRGKMAAEAINTLKFLPNKSARIVGNVVKSAMANAENNLNLDIDNLVISQAYVNQGPTMKRVRPRAMGRAFLIRKRSSHITVAVSDTREGR